LRTFKLYDPKIYSLILFNPGENDQKKVLGVLKSGFKAQKKVKPDISFKDGMAVIELMLDLNPNAKGPMDVSSDLIKLKCDEITKIRKGFMETILPLVKKGLKPHTYTLVTCGSNDRVWLRTFSDISFLYKDKKEEHLDILQTNITYLNRILNRSGEVIVNSLNHGKVSGSLYIMGNPQGKPHMTFLEDMVLEMDMGDVRSQSTYGESPIEVSPSSPYSSDIGEKKMYQMRQQYLINLMAVKAKIVELMLSQSHYLDLRDGELNEVFSMGRDLKDQIFQLQNNINNHMQLYVPSETEGKAKDKDFLDRQSFNTEKELLTRASVRFSLVSEVEHQIMRYSSTLHDLEQRITDASSSLSLKTDSVGLEGISYSLGELSRKEVDGTKRDLQNLLEELSRSRDILSSTIEVLRTFIDTRQREVSEEMSRLMNVLFLVFACIGLADALGNFVILAIEYIFLEDATVGEVLQWSSFGLIITLVPLLIAVIFLVMFFNKRR
jgi:hypothetical protein